MKFVVSHTSGWKEKPCVGAKLEELTYLDYRTVSSLEEAEKLDWYKFWFDEGINHRVENGMIVCDRKQKKPKWTIEIHDLEDLMFFIEKTDDIIISKVPFKEIKYEIEIYDEYRE